MRNTMAASVELVAVGFSHRLLEFDGGAKRAHGAGELHQRSVPGQLDQSPAMAGERRFQAFSHVALEPGERAVFVTAHQARIANDIRCQDRRQTSRHSLAGQEASANAELAALRPRSAAGLHLRYSVWPCRPCCTAPNYGQSGQVTPPRNDCVSACLQNQDALST